MSDSLVQASDQLPPEFGAYHSQHLWNTHSYINEYIRFADTKAAFVVAWASSLLGALYLSTAHHAFMQNGSFCLALSFQSILSLAAFLLLAIAFLCASGAILPRLPTEQRAGFIFWKSILVHATSFLFSSTLSRQTDKQLTHHLAIQVYTVAGVADNKYYWVNLAVTAAFIGSLLAVPLILAMP